MTETLIAHNYFDQDVYERELKLIFSRTWQYVGHVGKLQNEGDYFVCDVAGQSIVVIRSAMGDVKAFYNVCAHRAARLLNDDGCAKRIACPYHAWTYDTDGKLIAAPNSSNVPGFDQNCYRLAACAVEVLHGLVFVNLDSSPESLAAQAPGLDSELEDYAPDLPSLHFVHRTVATLRANWKVAVENFSECYHCQLIHKEFVNGVADPASYRIRVSGLWQKHQATSREGNDKAYDFATNGEHSDEFAAWYLWPNFAFQSYPGSAVHVWKWSPVAPDTTHVSVDWYFPNVELEPWQQELIQHHASTTFAEDIPIIESVQQGLCSKAYSTGPLMIDAAGSVMSEHGVLAIQDLWRDAMSADR